MFFQVITREGWVKYYNSQKIHMMVQKNGVLDISTLDGTCSVNSAFSLVSCILNQRKNSHNFISLSGTYLNSDRIISIMDCNGFTEVICELKGTAQRIQIKESALFILNSLEKMVPLKDFMFMVINDTEICLPVGAIFSFKESNGRTLVTTDCSFGSSELPITPYDFFKLMTR